MSKPKASVLLIGCGGVGTIAAINLENGGETKVTAVLRSNFESVQRDGFTIKSCDHGKLEKWRPSQGSHVDKFLVVDDKSDG
jgi:ketopantoate reductase